MSEGDENEMVMPEAIGDCGLRFLLAARHHVYLMNSLPMRQRAQLQQQGLSPAAYIWAFHSESEQVGAGVATFTFTALTFYVNFK